MQCGPAGGKEQLGPLTAAEFVVPPHILSLEAVKHALAFVVIILIQALIAALFFSAINITVIAGCQ